MKKAYIAPMVEKLDFAETANVTETILSSTGEIESRLNPTPSPDAGNPSNDNNNNNGHGDKGNGKGNGNGCKNR